MNKQPPPPVSLGPDQVDPLLGNTEYRRPESPLVFDAPVDEENFQVWSEIHNPDLPDHYRPAVPVPAQRFRDYQDLPNLVHRFWRIFGFGNRPWMYGGGAWLIDPDQWKPIVAPWLHGLNFTHIDINDHWVPLARGRYGDISLLGTHTLNTIDISPQTGLITGYNNQDRLPDEYFSLVSSALTMVGVATLLPARSELETTTLSDDAIAAHFGPLTADTFYGQKRAYCDGGNLPASVDDLAVLPISEIARYGRHPYRRIDEETPGKFPYPPTRHFVLDLPHGKPQDR